MKGTGYMPLEKKEEMERIKALYEAKIPQLEIGSGYEPSKVEEEEMKELYLLE